MGDYHGTEAELVYQYRVLDTSKDHLPRRLDVGHSSPQDSFTAPLHPPLASPQVQQSLLVYYPLLKSAQINNILQKNFLAHPSPATIVSQEPDLGPAASKPAYDFTKKAQTKARQSPQKTDGNNSVSGTVKSGKSQVTPDTTKMLSRGTEGFKHALPSRPPIVSQHSNSVPSTPHQHPRDITFRSRTPSPNGGLGGGHSPRSVSSEANGTLPSLRKQPYKCKYETGMAFGRRRIPYENSDPLEPAPETPKVALTPEEDDKLSGDMQELYGRLLPTPESEKRRRLLVKKLERILHEEWPGYEFKVHVFGSSGNLLCTTESDVDICIQTSMTKLESVHMLADALARRGMEKVVCVASAKVPIVKAWDPELQLACDMNVNNPLALENTRMIRTYVQIDDRVRPLTMIIKYWTKRRILNDAALGGTLSSYTWICMVLNFLQTRNPPILPALHQMPFEKHITEAGTESGFFDDLDQLAGFGKKNKESLGQLLFQFFRLYGHELDYGEFVVSVRHGRLLTRKEKGWEPTSGNKEGMPRLCVEEPFNTSRNLGNSADDYAFRGIHLELRQAFSYLADGGKLHKTCEQYEFPKEEYKSLFQKPPPAPKPTLTHSTSPSRRGGRGNGNRGGRNHYNQRNQGDRRASSAAAYGMNGVPFLQSPPMGVAGPDYFGPAAGASLHEQLYKQYHLLELQQHNLKAQLFAQAQARAQQAQALAQAQAQARNGQSNGSSPKTQTQYVTSHPRSLDDPPATAPIVPGFLYAYPNAYDQPQPMVQSSSQDGIRTNPSSPSLPLSVPANRRSVHRLTVAEGSANSSVRSHSQPARADQNTMILPGYPPIPGYPPNIVGYPIARSTQEQPPTSSPQIVDVPVPQTQPMAIAREPTHNGSPKEYLGYFMSESPQNVRALYQDYSVGPIPSYQDLQNRRRRLSPEQAQPQAPTTQQQQHASRSPSPLGHGHLRSHSTGLQNASLSTPPLHTADRVLAPLPVAVESGPVIVNGSYPIVQTSREQKNSFDSTGYPAERESFSSVTGSSARQDEPFPMEMPETQQQQLYANELLRRHYEGETVLTNGTSAYATTSSAVKVNSASVSTAIEKPVSSLNHVPANGTREENHSPKGPSPKSSNVPAWRVNAKPTNGMPPLDTSRTSAEPPQVIKSAAAALPLLSPVHEARTPSPTASRAPMSAVLPPVNGIGHTSNKTTPPRTTHGGKSHAHPKKDTPSAASEKSGKGSGGNHPSTNQWQKSAPKKKGRTRAKSNASKSGDAHREPMPANAADRKGG